MLDESERSPMKVADWGFSTFVHPGKKLTGLCGTCYYVAPVSHESHATRGLIQRVA
jgi:hypothetical protein